MQRKAIFVEIIGLRVSNHLQWTVKLAVIFSINQHVVIEILIALTTKFHYIIGEVTVAQEYQWRPVVPFTKPTEIRRISYMDVLLKL
jgi:hypothetical protein